MLRLVLVPFLTSAVFATYMPFCVPAVRATMPVERAEQHMHELWVQPEQGASRDLVYGPWGRERAPDRDGVFTFAHAKRHGVSPGLTVTDAVGREWSVKQGVEGPVEVVVSRILSAVGYHQPPIYYLKTFTLKDDKGTRIAPGGRFRAKVKELKEVGDWSFQQNPFVGSKPFEGLLVILLLVDSSDLKNSNNSLYEYRPKGDDHERWYVVRDVGTALGETGRLNPRRNDPNLFEHQPFIKEVRGSWVEFGYSGWHQELFRARITVDAVNWACNLMAGLTDRQWADAFAAAGYDPPVAARFIATLKSRIAEGQAIRETTAAH